ncbi:MAG: sodium/solute symporter [Spirochaetota bacterium]
MSGTDYYLGGNTISFWSIGISTMATQCSTTSLLGAPAFVIAVGGLTWLQYELAVPLAMIATMTLLVPFFRKQGVVSVYEYLELRFGVYTRTLLSVLFQILRAFATGSLVYGISIVLQQLLSIPFWSAVLLLGTVTLIYDYFGGMAAVVYSDVIQMILLYGGIILCLVYSIKALGGVDQVIEFFPKQNFQSLEFSSHGLGDYNGGKAPFLAMFFGGLFLYMSYYGCDQSQVQRELSTKNIDDTNYSLVLNGFLRFPLVVTYCLLGVTIGAYLTAHPEFVKNLIPAQETKPNYNLAVPMFVLLKLPHGVIGLVFVALFAAAMSSLDSVINSLSATTMRDIYERFLAGEGLTEKKQLYLSRLFTIFWGVVCITFAFFVGGISKSIIESINKISSLMNGPILATFLLAILTKRTNDLGALLGVVAGFAVNAYLWIAVDSIHWMWWNVIGCVVTFAVAYITSLFIGTAKPEKDIEGLVWQKNTQKLFDYKVNWKKYYLLLILYTFMIIGICYFFSMLSHS